MAMTRIPDIAWELSEDGDLLTIEQGTVEPTYVVLHRIHLKHFCGVMKLSMSEDEEDSPQLAAYLSQLHEQAERLYNYLFTVPSPSMDKEPEDVVMARELLRTANSLQCLWG